MILANAFMPATTMTVPARPSIKITARGIAQVGVSDASVGWYLIAPSVPRRQIAGVGTASEQ